MFSSLRSRVFGTAQAQPQIQIQRQPQPIILYSFNTKSTKEEICFSQMNEENQRRLKDMIQTMKRSINRNRPNIQNKKRELIENLNHLIYLKSDVKNMILFFLRKGTSGVIQGERKVEITFEDRSPQEPLIKIYFKDLEFFFKDIQFISSYTPFLSYKQLKTLKEDRTNKSIIHKIKDIVLEKGIARAEKNIESF